MACENNGYFQTFCVEGPFADAPDNDPNSARSPVPFNNPNALAEIKGAAICSGWPTDLASSISMTAL